MFTREQREQKKREAKLITEAYAEADRTNEAEDWRNYFTLLQAFCDECEAHHVDSDVFFNEKKFVSLDYSFGF